MYQIITNPSIEQWETFVRQQTRGHNLQQAAWGTLKAAFGWQVSRVALKRDAELVAGAQVLYRRLPARLGSMAYVPFGPYVTHDDQWRILWQAIGKQAGQRKAAFLKWEPGYYLTDTPPDFTTWGFVASPQTIQPPRTIMIDVRADDDTIMERMNQGTRRKIRKSLKSDVRYYEATRADIPRFTQMMQVTGDRNDFGTHEPEYYAMMYDQFVAAGDGVLLLAEHEGDPLAGIMVLALGRMAWYPAGASANIKRNLMATYGLQWHAIQWARARGCHYYDLWGVPDEDETTLEAQFQDRSDGLWGVYGFKRGWGGQVIRSAGAWDKAYNPLVYNAYRGALWWRENMR
jgi:peptidoglycan pentaglycine glycine transferase (the first glycine)